MPGPVKVASEEISGSAVANEIDPDRPVRSIVSGLSLLPATHSPATAPDAVLVFAAVMASRKVHRPSALLATSAVLLTVIVLPAALIVTSPKSDGFELDNMYTSEIAQIKMKMSARLRKRRMFDTGMFWAHRFNRLWCD